MVEYGLTELLLDHSLITKNINFPDYHSHSPDLATLWRHGVMCHSLPH